MASPFFVLVVFSLLGFVSAGDAGPCRYVVATI